MNGKEAAGKHRGRYKRCKKMGVLVWVLAAAFFIACVGEPPEPIDVRPTEVSAEPSTTLPSASPTAFVFDEDAPNYREAMRRWVMDISYEAKKADDDFIVIPQNASPLLTVSGEADGKPAKAFIGAIDGLGQESLCFGEGGYGIARSEKSREVITERLMLAQRFLLPVMSIDYCKGAAKVDFSDSYNSAHGFIGFAAKEFELTSVPEFSAPKGEARDVTSLSEAESFLITLNPENFSRKSEFIKALFATDYDVLIIDPDVNEHEAYTPEDIQMLKTKTSGGSRLVIAYLSIGEAEDYRAYWQVAWDKNPPDWIVQENKRWAGNYVVKYWRDEWKDIVLYSEDSMLGQINDLGFDGAYLDIVDAYEYFEAALE